MTQVKKFRRMIALLVVGLACGCGTQPAQQPLPAEVDDSAPLAGPDQTNNEFTELPIVGEDDVVQELPIGDEIQEPVPDETEFPDEVVEEELEPSAVLESEDLMGSWKLESGGNSLADIRSERGFETQYVDFDSNGVATIFSKSSLGGAVTDLPATYAFVSDGAIVIESASDAFDLIVLAIDMASKDELTTTDTTGGAATFTRVEAPPGDARPRTLFVVRSIETARPHKDTGLSHYEGFLTFTLQTEIIFSHNPDTNVIVSHQATASTFRFVQSGAVGTFLLSCSCANGADQLEPTALNVTGVTGPVAFGRFEFNPTALRDVRITAAAYDTSTNLMWASSESNVLLAMGNGVVLSELTFQTVDGLAVNDTSLWGLDSAGHVLIQIDPIANRVVQSRKLPRTDVHWYDLEFIGNRIFVLGEDLTNGEGILMEVATRLIPGGGPGGLINGDLVRQ